MQSHVIHVCFAITVKRPFVYFPALKFSFPNSFIPLFSFLYCLAKDPKGGEVTDEFWCYGVTEPKFGK